MPKVGRHSHTIAVHDVVIVQRRKDVTTLYIQGLTHAQIADRLGVSTGTVQKDLGVVREDWRREYLEQITLQKADEVAKLKNLERRAWEAYEKSCVAKKVSKRRNERTPQAPAGGGENAGSQGVIPNGSNTPMRLTRQTDERGSEQRAEGDPRFLDRIAWCIETRMKVLGMFKDTGTANVTNINLNWDALAVKTGEQRRNVLDADAIEQRIAEQLAQVQSTPVSVPALPAPTAPAPTEESGR